LTNRLYLWLIFDTIHHTENYVIVVFGNLLYNKAGQGNIQLSSIIDFHPLLPLPKYHVTCPGCLLCYCFSFLLPPPLREVSPFPLFCLHFFQWKFYMHTQFPQQPQLFICYILTSAPPPFDVPCLYFIILLIHQILHLNLTSTLF